MAGLEVLVISSGIIAVLAYWAWSRWQGRSVLRKLSGKGSKARKTAWKRLSEGEQLVVDRHHLRMLKLFAVAFSIALCGALLKGEIGFEGDLILLTWSGDVTRSENPAGYWILWLVASVIPTGLWALYFRERRALDERTTKAATRGNTSPRGSA